ncbi:MAG: type II toxin-antitoxin system HicA family toxin [Chloroflexota bacterium]
MSRKQKTLEKIRQNPGHVSFKDLDKLLTWYGFSCRQPGGGSSHHIYKLKVSGRPFRITVPYHRPHVKRTYVQKVLNMIDELEELGWTLEP